MSHPLGRGTLKFGADHTFIRRRDRFLNPQDLLPTTDSRIDERKTAAFAQYVLNVGKVSASAGLRYEHVRSRYYEQGILVPEQSRTYDDWLPTLSADFPLGKMQASLSALRGLPLGQGADQPELHGQDHPAELHATAQFDELQQPVYIRRW